MFNLANQISLRHKITHTSYNSDYIFCSQTLIFDLPLRLNFIKQLPIIKNTAVQLIKHKNYIALHCNNLILTDAVQHFPLFAITTPPKYALSHYTAIQKQTTDNSQQREITLQFNQAIDYQQNGQLTAAIALYQAILTRVPEHIDSLHYYGLALCDSGQHEQGIALIKQALTLNPNYAEAYNNLGFIYDEQGQIADAIACYKKAIEINPKHADAYCNLGGIYQLQAQFTEAINYYQHALSINPNHSYSHYNLGLIYSQQHKFSLAENSLQTTLKIQPRHINAYLQLGLIYTQQNRIQPAIACYQQILTIDGNHAQAHFNLAIAQLTLGDFINGFAEFEWRWQVRAAIEPKKIIPNAQEWRGQSLTNKSLLLYFEQGAGDAIQYSRYIAVIAKDYGGKIILQCPQVLISLFSTIPYLTTIIHSEQNIPAVDYYLSLLSLPWVLKTRLDTIPNQIPYLSAHKQLTIPLAIDNTKFNIGFVWAGNPAHPNNPQRSLDIRYFSTLTTIKQLQFYSLQLGDEATQLNQLTSVNPIINLAPHIKEFADTAALITELDLIICVDTAIAHLAGALNKPAWILLPFAADFRWLLEREDSPWYPSVRLFRQGTIGDWKTVFEKLKFALLTQLTRAGKIQNIESNPQDIIIDINVALNYHQTGQLAQAKLIYQQLLNNQPNHAVALHYLGLIYHQEGNTEYAIELLKKSLSIDAKDAIVHNNLGIIYMEKNQLDAAMDCYEQALKMQPDYAAAYYNKGYVLQKQQLLQQAINCYEQAILLNPQYTEAYHNLGLIYQAQLALDTAINYYEQALNSNPYYYESYKALGALYLQEHKFDLANAIYQRALAINPEFVDAIVQLAVIAEKQMQESKTLAYYQQATEYYQNLLQTEDKQAGVYFSLGNLYVKQGNFFQAQTCYEKELAINPQHADAHCNLGVAYIHQQKLNKAMDCFKQALAIDENHVDALCCLGNAYIDKNDLSLALIYLEKAFAINNRHTDTLNNLGLLYKNKNKLTEAMACYKQATQVDPYYANAHFNLAIILLLSGDYAAGWQEYEWRFKANKQLTPEQQFPNCQLWQGEKLLAKTLLIYAEQGLGDAIHFIRYITLVAPLVDNIIVQCSPLLHRLFRSIPQIKQLISFDQPLPQFDVYFPLMSLPRLFNTHLQTIPANVPYLCAPKESSFSVAMTQDKLNVGFVWVGNPGFKNDKNRSIDINHFQALTLLTQVQFYSLQVGDKRSDLSQISFANPVIDIGSKVKDFADTAAVIAQLDLVISVDTSVAHLAGALNKPTWILLPFSPDFRWLLAREDSPWYPSVRLFRQREAGVWEDVFKRVQQTLENEFLINYALEKTDINSQLSIRHQTVAAVDFNVAAACETAFKYHQSGQLAQAKQLYQQILTVDKENIDILHYLGLVLHQLGQTEQGVDLIKQAISINPNYITAYNNLGIIYMEKNQLDAAIDCHQQVITLNPNDASAYYNMGSAYQRKPNFTQAQKCYEQALSLNPNYAEAYYNLGVMYQDTASATAISYYETALSIQPQYPQAHYNLGTIYLKQHNYLQAISHYQAALAIAPNYIEAQCYLGHAYLKQKNFDDAVIHYEKALEIQADYTDALCGLGAVYLANNQLELAIDYYEQTLRLNPNYTEAYYNLGLVYAKQNNQSLALEYYKKTLQLDANYIEACCSLGAMYLEQKEFTLAIDYYQQALAINSDCMEAQHNSGIIYFKQNNFAMALSCFHQCLHIDPNYVDAYCSLGKIYAQQNQQQLAIEYYEKAVAINSQSANNYTELGLLYYAILQLENAIFYYEKALTVDSHYARAHTNLGFALLLTGDYETGWEEYEWRWQTENLDLPKMSFPTAKEWQGEHLAGKTILLYAEQGLGDSFQFIRYAALIAEYGAQVLVQCPVVIKALFMDLPYIAQVISYKDQYPHFDFYAPLMSLPRLFKTRLHTIPAQVPYLFVHKKLNFDLPFNKNTVNVGFVWAGNAKHVNNKNRSIDISHFQVFASINAVQFYSLQVGDSHTDLSQLQFVHPIIDVGSKVTDFVDTAAVITQLDLIICVDTSVAHLAGALNKPTWLLLPFVPDWRWLLTREDSPWYPSFRLFRQQQRGDWLAVFQHLKSELTKLADKQLMLNH